MSRQFLEWLILYLIFYLPGTLHLNKTPDWDVFNSIYFHFNLYLTLFPQILLILYLIYRKRPLLRKTFGNMKFKLKYIAWAFLVFIIVIMATTLTNSVFSLLFPSMYQETVIWQFNKSWLLIPAFFSCLFIGYSEELFFRVYSETQFRLSGFRKPWFRLIPLLLFSMGHLYEGMAGFTASFIAGLLFSLTLKKTRNIHIISLAHTFFNFSTLLAVFFLSDILS